MMMKTRLAVVLGITLMAPCAQAEIVATDAGRSCIERMRQMVEKAHLAYDFEGPLDYGVWSPSKKPIQPIFSALASCLKRSFKNTARSNKNGEDGTVFTTKIAEGSGDACELPDLGPMGGRGEHAGEYTIWLRCYRVQ